MSRDFKPSNTVYVNSEKDLPATTLISGVQRHLLEKNTRYYFIGSGPTNTLTLSDPLAMPIDGPVVIDGDTITILKYVGTDEMVFGTEIVDRLHINDLTLDGGGNAILLDLTSTTVFSELLVETSVFRNFADLGTVVGLDFTSFVLALFSEYASGLTISDSIEVTLSSGGFVTSLGTGITAVVVNLKTDGIVTISNVQGRISSTHSLFDFDDNSGAVTSFSLNVNGCNLDVDGSFLASGSVDHANVNSRFVNNTREPNSRTLGSLLMEDNATPTVISTLGVWTKILGTTVAGMNIERARMTANNTIEFDNIEQVGGNAIVSINLEMVSDASIRDVEVSIFKNSAKIANAKLFKETNNKSSAGSIIAPTSFLDGDVFEVYARNLTNTDNILVTNMQLNIQ